MAEYPNCVVNDEKRESYLHSVNEQIRLSFFIIGIQPFLPAAMPLRPGFIS